MCYGPEFIAKAVQDWITAVGAKTAHIAPGSPYARRSIWPGSIAPNRLSADERLDELGGLVAAALRRICRNSPVLYLQPAKTVHSTFLLSNAVLVVANRATEWEGYDAKTEEKN